MTAAAVDLVISFDTTSSMHAVLDSARRSLSPMLASLFGASPDLRVGIVAHGDYDDLYETRIAQPTDSAASLVAFLARTPGTCGLDYPECYELVLHQAASKIHWRPQARRRILVMLGDAVPHEVGSKRNKYQLDWRKEARNLASMAVEVYCVDCGGVGTGFYAFGRELSDACAGAIVPYRGCKRLERLLMRLLLAGGGGPAGVREALARQYRGYHNDSQRADTVRTAGCATSTVNNRSGSSSRCQAMTTTTTRPTTTTTALTLVGAAAAFVLGKTAHCATRLLMYLGLTYLVYSVWIAACL